MTQSSRPTNEPNQPNQRVEQKWETPSHDEIVQLTRAHVAAMETTNADAVWIQAGMPHVLLETVGRRSGNRHKVALPTWTDPDGDLIIVASFAGSTQHPSWYLNLTDTESNPNVRCLLQSGPMTATPQILEGSERDDLWAQLTRDRAWYRDYEAKAGRQIPLVRLRAVDDKVGDGDRPLT